MRYLRLFILPAALLALVAAGCGGNGSGNVPGDAVATVGGTPIPKSEFDQLMDQARRSFKAQKRPFPKETSDQFQQLKGTAVKILVQRAEFAKEAEEMDVEISDKRIAARLAQLKKQYFGGDERRYRAQLKAQGLTEEAVRADVKNQLINEALFDKVTKDVKIAPGELKQYYDSHQDQYGTPESRVVRHILVKKKALANRIYDQLQAGASFAALAKKYSKDPGSASQGGKLTVSRGQTVPPFDQTAFLLGVGKISRPVKTEYGYHIISPISAVKPAKTTPFKEVEQSIRQLLLQQEKQEKMTAFVNGLNKKFNVKYQVGYRPPSQQSGGSTTTPAQTTPAG